MARPSCPLLLGLVLALALSATLPTPCVAKSSKRKAGAPRPPPSPKPSPPPPRGKPPPSPPRVLPSPPPPKAKSPPPSPRTSPPPKSRPPPKSPPPAKSPPPPKSSPAPVSSPPAGPTPQPTTTCTTHAPMTQGRWVSKPFNAGFTSSCPFISPNFKCSSGSATQYSWQPNTCNLPTFNPSSFATRYAGKTILLVGDSIMKNMFEALACIIEQSSPVASDPVDFKSPVQLVERHFIFTGLNNLTLILVKDVYLSDDYTAAVPVVRQAWRSLLLQSSLAVFTTGHWYLHNGVTTATATAQLENMIRSLGNYLRTLSQAPTNWQGTAALLTYTPVHKSCASFSRPFSDSEYTAAIARDRADDMTAAMLRGLQGFPEVKIVDVTDMSFWRIDAHGPNDCSHWCTPGIPSVWLNMLNVVI